jgi:CHAD domain-containing protein
MAGDMMLLDPDPSWTAMRKAGRKLFRRLGDLRDTQVMLEWLERISPRGSAPARSLRERLNARAVEQQQEAANALVKFDRREWKHWAGHLSSRAARVALDGPVFQHIALERWLEARALHRRALRNRSRTGWHSLRIGIKRFRYSVENFLPALHREWGRDLKFIQDQLGEVHDLDVLGLALEDTGEVYSLAERHRWRELLEKERNTRLAEYRGCMTGRESFWRKWRNGLPHGSSLEEASLLRLACWAEFRQADATRTRRVLRLALDLFDGLERLGVPGPYREAGSRKILRAAALMHDAGRASSTGKHHKKAWRMVRDTCRPAGWVEEEFRTAALVVRYQGGALPSHEHGAYAAISPAARETVLHLGGVLRLAISFEASNPGKITRITILDRPDGILLLAKGYDGSPQQARELAAERHLLERALRRPLIIQPHAVAPRSIRPRKPLTAAVVA